MQLNLKTLRTVLTVLCFIITPNLFAQSSSKFADSVIIYKGLYSGGTTANLRYLSIAADTMTNVTKVVLRMETVDSLNLLLKGIKVKKHFQQKIGPSYYAVVHRNDKEYKFAIIPNFALIDLTNSKQYNLSPKLKSLITEIINKNYR